MISRGGKQLEGPKRGGNDVSLHDEHGEHVKNDENEMSTPSNDVIVNVHNSKEAPKDFKITSQRLTLRLCHSLKEWLRLNLICNLGSF